MKNFLLIIALCFGSILGAQANDVLTYSAPSNEWMGSLPLGNGRIGVMVYGGYQTETIALSEVTMWSGKPEPTGNDLCGPENLKKMREAFFRGDFAEGNRLGNENLNGHARHFGTNLPFGDIVIKFDNHDGDIKDYSRRLNMRDAVANVDYTCNGVKYKREYFSSNPDQALVARFSSSSSKMKARIGLNMLRYGKVVASGNEIVITGDARFDKWGEGGVKYQAIVRVVADGAKITAEGEELVVEGTKEFMLITDIRTDWNSPEYKEILRNTVDKVAAQKYNSLKKKHIADFRRIYDRIDIGINDTSSEGQDIFELVKQVKSGKPSAAFDALFFKYGRYMLISSSRENSPLPANLQGIWNDNLACNMPWTCDYHLDINIQQNYWSSNIANLHECNVPLFAYLKMLSIQGHETAQKMYGCDGWVAHTVNNVWGYTWPANGLGWSMNVTAGAWMATHLWTHYDFTRDVDYLRNVGYPLLKETAKFFVDYMVEDPNTGYLVTGPSISPENGFRMADGSGYSLSMMPTIDRAVVYDIYQACIKSSRVLGIDDDFRARLEKDIKRLPPYQIGSDGALQEWLLDVKRQDPSHRHASHLLSLHPFGEISPLRTPALAKSCEKFLELQTKHGQWEDTEWTRGSMINFYARLKNGNEAYASLNGLYTGFMRENLMTVSPAGIAGAESDIFSFDATEAAVAGVCEMILQSHDGFLDFLPALPDDWKSGYIKGVCARGGIEADIEWKDGKVVKVTLRSNADQEVQCRYNGTIRNIQLKAGKNTKLDI